MQFFVSIRRLQSAALSITHFFERRLPPIVTPEMEGKKPNWPLLAITRFFLACVVFSHHCHQVTDHGWLVSLTCFTGSAAVLGFFMISGFSIAHSVTSKPKGYYNRRIRRIYPTYLACFVLAMIPWAIYKGISIRMVDGNYIEMPTMREFLCTAVLLQGILSGPDRTMATSWTLVIEEWLYWLAPAFRRLPSWLLTIGLLYSAGLYYYDFVGDGMLHTALPCLAWAWLIGFLLYRHEKSPLTRVGILVLPSLVAVHSGLSTASATLVLTGAVLVMQNEILIPARWHKLAFYLGDISYEIYLIGLPVMLWLWAFWPKAPQILYPAITFVLCNLILFCVDRPLRYRSKRGAEGATAVTDSPSTVPSAAAA